MRSNAHSRSDLKFHIVFCTQCRRKILTAELVPVVEKGMRVAVWSVGGICTAMAINPDHVHLVCELPPSASIPALVSKLKMGSTIALLEHAAQTGTAHPQSMRWARGYFVGSIGDGTTHRVEQYVKNQRE